jgi:methyl-accepting chemotaxis protein
MKGIGKRVTVAFLSIAALLSVSGVISLVELNDLSYDAEDVITAGGREMEVARRLIRSAHTHSHAMIDISVFGDNDARIKCVESAVEIGEIIASARKSASEQMSQSLDQLAAHIADMQRLAEGYVPFEAVGGDTLTMVAERDARGWYKQNYEPVYDRYLVEVERYTELLHAQLAPRAALLSKNAHRSVIPVFISLLVMIAVVLMFYFFIYIYGVKPILSINKALADYLQFKIPYKPKADMVDEIKDLNDNIENLVNITRSQKKQEENAI